jgi:hypothetical protein
MICMTDPFRHPVPFAAGMTEEDNGAADVGGNR